MFIMYIDQHALKMIHITKYYSTCIMYADYTVYTVLNFHIITNTNLI